MLCYCVNQYELNTIKFVCLNDFYGYIHLDFDGFKRLDINGYKHFNRRASLSNGEIRVVVLGDVPRGGVGDR